MIEAAAPYRHIACCVDRSAAADAGLAEAVRLAAILGARLSLVHVASPPLWGYSRWGPMYAPFYAEAGDWLAGRVTAVPGAEPVLLWGFAAERACEWAADAGVDLMVAATHRGPLRRALLGSFTSHLVRRAPCPVLVVHPGETGPGDEREALGAAVDASGVLLATDRSPIRDAADWRPGDLLLAALGRCILDSLRHEATLAGLVARAQAVVTGMLDPPSAEGTATLRDVHCRVELTLDPPRSDEEVARLAAAAERGCPLASALAAPPRFEWVHDARHIRGPEPDREEG